MEIVTYKQQFKTDFKAINVEWLEDMFYVEDYDLKILENPEKYILKGDGNIWFVLHEGKAVGTCALMEQESGHYELTKMGVYKRARGLKAGEKLLSHVIDCYLKIPNKKSLFLLTNTKCEAAIHLYEKVGFFYDENICKKYGSSYERCNYGMLYQEGSLT